MSEQVAALHAQVSANTQEARANLSRFREALEQTGRGANSLGTSIDKSTTMAGRSLDALAGKAKNTSSVWSEFTGGLKQQLVELATLGGAGLLMDGAIDLTKHGDQIRRMDAQLLAYAGTLESAERYTRLVQNATDGAATKFEATGAAAVLLKNRIATNTTEMEKFARAATVIGQTTGLSVSDYAKEMAAAFANSSWDRLDQLGIVSMNVRERVEELKKSGMGLQEAFRVAVIEDMTRQAALLEQAGVGSATALERMGTAGRDFTDGVAVPMSQTVADLTKEFGAFFGVISGGQQIDLNKWGQEFANQFLLLSGISQGIENIQKWNQMLMESQARHVAYTEATQQSAIANNLLAVAIQRSSAELQNIPLDNTEAQTKAVAAAFLQAGREAGLTQSEIIRLWVATGGLSSELGIAGNKNLAYATTLNEVGHAARQATRDVLLFKEAALDRQFRDINTTPRLDTRFGMQEATAYRNQVLRTGADEFFEPTPQHVIDNANWKLDNMLWKQPWKSTGGGGGGSGLSDVNRQAQQWEQIWTTAAGNVRSAVTASFDMSIAVSQDDMILTAAGLYKNAFNESGRLLEDVKNRGAASPHAKTFFASMLGMDEASLKAQAVLLQRDISDFLRPELLNTDAALEKARRALIGNRNREAMADQITQVLLGEGFGLAEVQSELAKQLGLNIPTFSTDMGVQLADSFYLSVQANRSQFEQAGALIKEVISNSTNGAGRDLVAYLVAEVLEEVTRFIEEL